MRIANHRQRGDTIIEVLLSIAVVSVMLGGAYVTTNRSLLATRAAQEQAKALKIAQGQLEQVKNLAAIDPTTLFGSSTLAAFCVDDNDQVVPAANAACAVSSGVPVYRTSIVRLPTNDFALTESWLDVRGANTNTLQLHYRVYD